MTSHPKYQNIKKLKWKIQVNKNYGKKYNTKRKKIKIYYCLNDTSNW